MVLTTYTSGGGSFLYTVATTSSETSNSKSFSSLKAFSAAEAESLAVVVLVDVVAVVCKLATGVVVPLLLLLLPLLLLMDPGVRDCPDPLYIGADVDTALGDAAIGKSAAAVVAEAAAEGRCVP
jgi:hypothetical protein